MEINPLQTLAHERMANLRFYSRLLNERSKEIGIASCQEHPNVREAAARPPESIGDLGNHTAHHSGADGSGRVVAESGQLTLRANQRQARGELVEGAEPESESRRDIAAEERIAGHEVEGDGRSGIRHEYLAAPE